MPKVSNVPAKLRPYHFHGVAVNYDTEGEEAVGDCPFCGREGKFSINLETGTARCFVCVCPDSDRGGWNPISFMRQLWRQSYEATTKYDDLARDRTLLFPDTLMHWGVCRSTLLRDVWLVPGYNRERHLVQLYKYVRIRKSNGDYRSSLLCTPDTGHGLLMPVDYFDPNKEHVWVTEGCWDGMALWEVMKSAKEVDTEYKLTGAVESSLLANTNVVAVPSATVFSETWFPLFAGKNVALFGHNDYPSVRNGRTTPPASYAGMKRVANLFSGADEKPLSVAFSKWGEVDHNPNLKDGWDVRDHLASAGNDVHARIAVLPGLFKLIEPIPTEWIAGRAPGSKRGGVLLDPLPCQTWKILREALGQCMRMEGKQGLGLDRALSIMLAVILSTPGIDDQVWLRVISPASSGKSTLCEGLVIAVKYVEPVSIMTGMFSGVVDAEGKDHSLIARMDNKCMVIKDAGPLLESKNRDDILNQLRDIYDKVSRPRYKNKVSNTYDLNMTLILCGTSSLHTLDTSELGERCLTTVIMEEIEEDEEKRIQREVRQRAHRNRSQSANCRPESQFDPAMVRFKQLCGGYINYLRENHQELLDLVYQSEEAGEKLDAFARLIAYMRARPSKKQDEVAEREMSMRLTIQLTRLADCLAAVLNRSSVDDEVLTRIKSVALDSSRGQSMDLCHLLYADKELDGDDQPMGLPNKAIGIMLHQPTEPGQMKIAHLLRFLARIGVVEYHRPELSPGLCGEVHWRLTAKMRRLYEQVFSVG